MGSKGSSTNEVVISNRIPRYRIRKKAVIRLAELVLKRLGYRQTTVSVVFVSDRTIKELNQRFLKHPWPTDVLAFSFMNFQVKRKFCRVERPLGEIIISPRQARLQAKQFNKTMNQELIRYVCHGILHLSGHSDRTLREQNAMHREEDGLLQWTNRYLKRII